MNLSIDNLSFSMIEVVAARRSDMLLGRDVLNHLKMVLDGKGLSFDLIDP